MKPGIPNSLYSASLSATANSSSDNLSPTNRTPFASDEVSGWFCVSHLPPPFSLLLPQTSSILFVTTSLKTQADALTSYPLANNSLRDFSDFSTLHHHPKNHNHPNPSYHQSIPTLPSRFTDIHVFQASSGLKRALLPFFPHIL